MKTKLTLACLLFSAVLTAQVTTTPITIHSNLEWGEEGQAPFGVIPKLFSYDGTNRVYLLENNQVSIYSNSFSPVRSFPIEPNTCNEESRIIVTERREAIGKIVKKDNQSYTDGPLPISYELYGETITTDQIPSTWTLADIITYLANHSYNVVATKESDGTTLLLSNNENDYFKYDTYARQYPETYWALENNQLIWHRNYYYECNIFSDTWTEYSRENSFVNLNIGLGMFDYDDGEFQYTWGDNVGLLTQTLFNDDAQYEYINFLPGEYKLSEYGNEPDCGEDCHCDDEYISRRQYYHARCAGFEILSETGSTLCSVTFPATVEVRLWYYTATLIKLDNQYYICISADLKGQEERVLLCYHIERSNNGASVHQVSAPMPIAAYPSPANRNQTITINLGGDNKTATDVQVINMNGQVLDRRTIPAGQQQTTLPASSFAPGTNLINATQNGQPVGTARIIVK